METTTWERKGALKYAVWTYLDARVGSVHREHLEESLDLIAMRKYDELQTTLFYSSKKQD